MLTSSTFGTAILRALYSAVVVGLVAGLTSYQTNNDTKDAIIVGVLAALSILMTRGAGEGSYDQSRQDAGAVSKADVQPNVVVGP